MSAATATVGPRVAASVTAVTLFAAEAGSGSGADGRFIYNDSTATLYVKFGSSAATSDYTVQIAPQGYFEFPANSGTVYQGLVTGIWTAANGFAYVTAW